MSKSFFKSKKSDKGVFLEVKEDEVSVSLWEKSSKDDVKLDFKTALDLVEFIKKTAKNDLSNDEIYKNNVRWEKHIIDTLNKVNPEDAENE
tara:strand:- start:319 stop:591 length:273 start_codon:yes stop_codon:yes gene_type:complete